MQWRPGRLTGSPLVWLCPQFVLEQKITSINKTCLNICVYRLKNRSHRFSLTCIALRHTPAWMIYIFLWLVGKLCKSSFDWSTKTAFYVIIGRWLWYIRVWLVSERCKSGNDWSIETQSAHLKVPRSRARTCTHTIKHTVYIHAWSHLTIETTWENSGNKLSLHFFTSEPVSVCGVRVCVLRLDQKYLGTKWLISPCHLTS